MFYIAEMSSPIDIIKIQKMVFVFNAILAGWTVRMIDENTFEFKKDRRNQEVNLDNYLRRFVIHNLSIDSISSNTNNQVINTSTDSEHNNLDGERQQDLERSELESPSTVRAEDITNNDST